MSKEKNRQPSLDPLMEGYLDYLANVARKAAGTVRDVRCTLHRVGEARRGEPWYPIVPYGSWNCWIFCAGSNASGTPAVAGTASIRTSATCADSHRLCI
jgi:hypothetical protein